MQDIGTGSGTVIAQTVAETLGLEAQDVVVKIGDTIYPPGPPSHGSRTTASMTPPARVASWKLRQAMLAEAARQLNAAPEELELSGGSVFVKEAPARKISFAALAGSMPKDALAFTAKREEDYGGFRRIFGEAAQAQQDLGGAQFAEVLVDTETGIIRVERVVAVQDCGRPINPRQLESQAQGGVLMGVSYALYEERLLDAATGRMVNANLEQYKLVGPREAPRIDVVVLENYQGRSATDAYGVAEPSNIATAPAIANAVYQRHRGQDARAADDAVGGARSPFARRSEEGKAMTGFAFSHAQSVAEAAAKADLVSEAMLAPPNAPPPATSFVKAGGIDLIDLIKERLVSPSELISLRDVAGLDQVSPDPDGRTAHRRHGDARQRRREREVLAKYPALAEAVGHSASLELRNLATIGGNLLQRPRCWYFRAAENRCLRKGGGHCFAILGENRFHAIFDNRFCAIVHPSTAATALVALDASIELVDDGGAKRTAKLESFFIGPDRDVQRENDLQANEILTAILLPSAADKRMAHLKLSQKESFDWPLADVAAVLDLGADGICRRASIVLGAAAPTPHRARAAEAVLQGQRIDEASPARPAARRSRARRRCRRTVLRLRCSRCW